MKQLSGLLQQMIINAQSKMKRMLTGPSLIPLEIRESMEQETTVAVLKRLVVFLPLVILLQIANLFVDAFTAAHPVYRFAYHCASLFLLILTIISFLLVLYLLTKKRQQIYAYRFFISIFWFLFSVGDLFFVCLDLLESQSLVNWLVLLIVTAVIPLFPFLKALFFFMFDLFVVLAFCLFFPLPVYLVQQIIFLAIGSFILSQILYDTHFNTFINRKKLEKLAATDPLTGLLNRRGADQKMKEMLHLCQQEKIELALFIIDIDRFKQYNDTYGHEQGDYCLAEVSRYLKGRLAGLQFVVARYGGEEFLIMASHLTEKASIALGKQIREEIEVMEFTDAVKGISETVTVSLGLTWYAVPLDIAFSTLFQEADTALYQAKGAGRNCLAYNRNIYR